MAEISHGFWVSGFARIAASSAARSIINGHPYTVVGVAQRGFDGMEVGRPVRVFVPMMMKAQLTPGWDGARRAAVSMGRAVRTAPARRHGQAGAGSAVADTSASLIEADLKDSPISRGRHPRRAALHREHACGARSGRRAIRTPSESDQAALGADGDRRRRPRDRVRQRRQPAPRPRRGPAARDRHTARARRDTLADRAQLAGRERPVVSLEGSLGLVAAIGVPAGAWLLRHPKRRRVVDVAGLADPRVHVRDLDLTGSSSAWRRRFSRRGRTSRRRSRSGSTASRRPRAAAQGARRVAGRHLAAARLGAALFTRTLGNLLAVDLGFDTTRDLHSGSIRR